MKRSDRLAQKITSSMATWTFVAIFLALSLLEIWTNRVGIVTFDPQTIILNLILSLVAAIQGSIIMIAQKQSDAKSDARAQKTYEMVEQELKIVKQELILAQKEREELRQLHLEFQQLNKELHLKQQRLMEHLERQINPKVW